MQVVNENELNAEERLVLAGIDTGNLTPAFFKYHDAYAVQIVSDQPEDGWLTVVMVDVNKKVRFNVSVNPTTRQAIRGFIYLNTPKRVMAVWARKFGTKSKTGVFPYDPKAKMRNVQSQHQTLRR